MSNLSTATLAVGRHADGGHMFGTQGTEQGGDAPDVNRPADQHIPDFGTELPGPANDPGSPPFTGEDLEDPGKRRRRRRPQDEPNGA